MTFRSGGGSEFSKAAQKAGAEVAMCFLNVRALVARGPKLARQQRVETKGVLISGAFDAGKSGERRQVASASQDGMAKNIMLEIGVLLMGYFLPIPCRGNDFSVVAKKQPAGFEAAKTFGDAVGIEHIIEQRLDFVRPYPDTSLEQAEFVIAQGAPQDKTVFAADDRQIETEHAPLAVPRKVPVRVRIGDPNALSPEVGDREGGVCAASVLFDEALVAQPFQQLLDSSSAGGLPTTGQNQAAITARECFQTPEKAFQEQFILNSHRRIFYQKRQGDTRRKDILFCNICFKIE